MVKAYKGAASSGSARDICVRKFTEWWTPDDMRRIMSQMDSNAMDILACGGADSPDRLAGFLYDMAGPRFLREGNDLKKRRMLLREILASAIKKKLVLKADIVRAAASATRDGHIRTVHDVVQANMTAKLGDGLARALGLPQSVARKESAESLPRTEIIEPHAPLNPLHDYQHATDIMVRRMLEGKHADARGQDITRVLIAAPVGFGKTDIIVQTLVRWLNDGKPSRHAQQKDSKFVLWISQSGELCEQAFDAFRNAFESAGRRGTTLRLHRFWEYGGASPKTDMADMPNESDVIVAAIQSLHKALSAQPAMPKRLAHMISCIVIDEARYSIDGPYSSVLRSLGFNWDDQKTEISELGIILIGLTAIPFRGNADNEAQRLKGLYGNVHFPPIPHIPGGANCKPHALIDCRTSALAGEDIRIVGERSYDQNGLIRDAGYFWNIRRVGPGRDPAGMQDAPCWTRRDEWALQGSRNVSFVFDHSGVYEISLRVTGNEGDVGETSTRIKISESGGEDDVPESEPQKALYRTLVKRKELCEVYHHVLDVAGAVCLDEHDENHLKVFDEFRSKTLKNMGDSVERNDIIIHEIMRLRHAGRKKILFFGCSIEHSRRMALYLKMKDVRASCAYSRMEPGSRAAAIEEFRGGDLEVLCNFGVPTTGFHAPGTDCIFVGRPIKSAPLYVQMIERGVRGIKSGGTEDVLVVDMDDNFQMRDRSTVELGWKMFEPYWKRWEGDGDAQFGTATPENDTPEDGPGLTYGGEASDGRDTSKQIAEPVPVHVCPACGIKATGEESIKETFGTCSLPEAPAGFPTGKKRDEPLPVCHRCRTKRQEGLAAYMAGHAGVAGSIQESKTQMAGAAPPDPARGRLAAHHILTTATERMLQKRFDDIICKGKKSSAYKFALAAYLVKHAGGKDAGPTIKYADIAAAFLKYHWHQVTKYGVRQNHRGQHQPHIVTIIRGAFSRYQGELADMPRDMVQGVVADVLQNVFGTASAKTSQVVPRFQVIGEKGTSAENAFYDYSDAKKTITLRPEALAFFRRNRAALLEKVFVEWARFLEKVNAPAGTAAGVRRHLERHGISGNDGEAVAWTGAARCLACGTKLWRNDIRLYRLMPWSYVFESQGWPRVILCCVCRDITCEGTADPRLIGRLTSANQDDGPYVSGIIPRENA